MFLDVHELELHSIEFDECLPPGRIDFGRGVKQVEPLAVQGSAELLESEIRIHGRLHTALEICCDRCLEPTHRSADADFDLFYRPMQTIAVSTEVEITDEDLDVGFYEGNGLLLEDAVKEQVLLTLPMKNVCRPDCAGLCPQCGQNRNLGECACDKRAADPRWAALGNIAKPR